MESSGLSNPGPTPPHGNQVIPRAPASRASSHTDGPERGSDYYDWEVVSRRLNDSGVHDASDEHSGAEVRAEHRPHLGAEQWTRAEDLGALSDQMLGVLG